jgi:heme/copper-type cytochrome/quinol oxidase subunit 3
MAAEGLRRPQDAAQAAAGRAQHLDHNVLGVAFFISSEVVFFLALIVAFVVYRGRDVAQSAGHLDVPRTAIFTVVLLASSATVVLAERRLAAGDRGGAKVWLALTILLGLAFIANQVLEYAGLLRNNVTPQSSLWATTFFTLTGFHGFHVLVGLLALAIVLGVALAGEVTERRHSALTATSLYWHFVDAVWIVVFTLAYLWR